MYKAFRVLLVFVCLLLTVAFSSSAEAKSYRIYGAAQTSFSTAGAVPMFIIADIPPQDYALSSLKVVEPMTFKMKVLSVREPARGKRNATILASLVSISYGDKLTHYFDVSDDIKVKIKKYSEIDFKTAAVSVATTTAGVVFKVPLLSQGVAAVKGAVLPNDGQSRLESIGRNVYESTPLPYAEKGEELTVSASDNVTLVLKFDPEHIDLTKYGFAFRKVESENYIEPDNEFDE